MKIRIKHFDFVTEGSECLVNTSTALSHEENPISEILKEYIKARRIVELNEERMSSCQEKIEEFMSNNDIEIVECEIKNINGRFANLIVTDRWNEKRQKEYFNTSMLKKDYPSFYAALCETYPINCSNYDFNVTYGTEIETNND